MRQFDKVLVANRGEIAVRVMRSCHEMGLSTVAVFSEADRTSPFVLMADEAVPIGPPPANESYLNGERIIKAAISTGAGAIHPGYGFLAENADFAQAVIDAGLVFIGPPPEAIRAMGSKTEARRKMMEAGVPVVPGDRSGLTTADAAFQSAEKIGYPVLIKSAMGGGGKGMRIVHSAEEMPAAFESARRESLKAFGSDEIYLERLILNPHHIEVQVLADIYGNCIHLYERECSVQRRHQKVIEEAPAPGLKCRPEIREQMGSAAVAAAKACGYVNAGTVEFLFDNATSEYFFLEMNTRLQVEHPVTEMVTGIDLVKQQLLIAMGEPLNFKQENVNHRGHSIEVRIYAEDPSAGFMPDAGRVETLSLPNGPWTRVDCGVAAGDEVGVYYDPLVAKLIVWAPDRHEAIRRMARALSEFQVVGIATTIPFAQLVMENVRFQSGDYDTGFIEREFNGRVEITPTPEVVRAAALAAVLSSMDGSDVNSARSADINFKMNGIVRNNQWKLQGRARQLR